MVRESLEPGQSVSVVARRNGINANQLFLWRKLYQDDSLSAVSAGEAVVPASERPVKLVSECHGVARSQLTVLIKQSVSPQVRRSRPVDDAELVVQIQQQVSELPS